MKSQLFLIFSENLESCYWVGKDSLKSWRRMYLEIFESFVNNHDVLPNIELPLNPDLLSSVYDTSSRFVEEKQYYKAIDSKRFMKMDGITLDSIDGCRKLARLFVNNSVSIFKILKLNDYESFYDSLLELESVLEEMTHILSSVIVKKVTDALTGEVKTTSENPVSTHTENNTLSCKIQTERETKINNGHKEDDENNSHEDKEKQDDSDSLDKNDTEYLSWVFNEDITCPHGTVNFK